MASEEYDRETTRRGFLAALASASTAAVAGCGSNVDESSTTDSTTAQMTTTTTEAAETYETRGLRFPLWEQEAVVVFDRLVVGDKLGEEPAADGHKWILAPVYIDVDQTDGADIQLPELDRFRVDGVLGEQPSTQPLGWVLEPRKDSRPSYRIGDQDVKHYPVDGVPETVNDPDTMTFPKFGIAFHAPENAGYKLQILGKDTDLPVLSMVAKPPTGEYDGE